MKIARPEMKIHREKIVSLANKENREKLVNQGRRERIPHRDLIIANLVKIVNPAKMLRAMKIVRIHRHETTIVSQE